jgi:ribosomal protein L3 glutamine methyltransferase
VDAIDVSLPALEVAAINQARYHLEEQLTLIHSDCWQSIPHANRYDIIVSNPPYVGDEEMLTLPKEYCHEPDMALRATNNGLAIVEEILKKAASYLNEKGILVVEVGNSEDALVEAYPNVPFMWLEFECGGEGVFMLTREQLQEFFS